MKKLILLFFCFAFLSASAQPILTGATNNYAIGDTFYIHKCDTVGMSVGASGSGCVWNFAGLMTIENDTQSVVSCSSTPYCDSFPVGSVAVMRAGNLYDIGYFIGTNDYEVVTGNHSDEVGYSYMVRQDTLLKYPMSYLKTWNDTSLEIYDTTYASSHLFRTGKSIVDGYGTLTLPIGTFTNVLRIHHIVYLTDSNYNTGILDIHNYRTDNYSWHISGFHSPLLYIEVDNDLVTGAINDVYYATYMSGRALNTLSVLNESKDNLKVFPNPAKDVLHISGANIKGVELMDMTGKMLTSVDGCGSITLRTSTVANGIYLLKVKTDNGAVMKKIVIGQ